jgi:hypothetical protein
MIEIWILQLFQKQMQLLILVLVEIEVSTKFKIDATNYFDDGQGESFN